MNKLQTAETRLPRIEASEVYFIKLGRGGKWEEECLRDGILRFGYDEASHKDCEADNWDAVFEHYLNHRGDKRTARSDTNQIETFYTAPETALFITFWGGRLYWCRAANGVEIRPNADHGTHIRQTVDGWRSESIGANLPYPPATVEAARE